MPDTADLGHIREFLKGVVDDTVAIAVTDLKALLDAAERGNGVGLPPRVPQLFGKPQASA